MCPVDYTSVVGVGNLYSIFSFYLVGYTLYFKSGNGYITLVSVSFLHTLLNRLYGGVLFMNTCTAVYEVHRK